MKVNTKIFCIICLVSISILILILLRYNFVEKYNDNKKNLLNKIFDKIYVINLKQEVEKI